MKKRFKVALGTGVALASIVLAGHAATKAIQASHPSKAPKEVPGQANLTVGYDPETGTLGPVKGTVTLSEEELNAVDSSDEGLVEVQHANGSSSIDLQGRFQSLEIARVMPDGTVKVFCVDSKEQAAAALNAPTTGLEEK